MYEGEKKMQQEASLSLKRGVGEYVPCYGYGNRGEEQLQPQLIASNNKYAVAHRGPQQRHRYHLGT